MKQLGGVTHQNAGSNTTYLVAAEPGGYKYDGQVGGDRQDILAVGWLQECLAEGRLLEQMPRHLLHLCAMVGSCRGGVEGWGWAQRDELWHWCPRLVCSLVCV